jgi:hypothetical protein
MGLLDAPWLSPYVKGTGYVPIIVVARIRLLQEKHPVGTFRAFSGMT